MRRLWFLAPASLALAAACSSFTAEDPIDDVPDAATMEDDAAARQVDATIPVSSAFRDDFEDPQRTASQWTRQNVVPMGQAAIAFSRNTEGFDGSTGLVLPYADFRDSGVQKYLVQEHGPGDGAWTYELSFRARLARSADGGVWGPRLLTHVRDVPGNGESTTGDRFDVYVRLTPTQASLFSYATACSKYAGTRPCQSFTSPGVAIDGGYHSYRIVIRANGPVSKDYGTVSFVVDDEETVLDLTFPLSEVFQRNTLFGVTGYPDRTSGELVLDDVKIEVTGP